MTEGKCAGMADVEIAEMSISDHDEVAALWEATECVGFDEDDSRENVQAYLQRNPGLSYVARCGGDLVGTVLCGHDGRRGYLHHLAVPNEHRRRGIGAALVDRCILALKAAGIRKCNIFVFGSNESGLAFWSANGWNPRGDLTFMQKET